jgi:segregation and condensation protein B
MSEENEQIVEESPQEQPAAQTPEPVEADASAETPRPSKSRKKGRRSAAQEAGDPASGTEDAPAETPGAGETAETVAEDGEPSPEESPASSGRKPRRKGKRNAEEASGTDESSVDAESPENGTSEPVAEGETPADESPAEAEGDDSAEPPGDEARHSLPLVVEAILFASQKPMSAKELLSVLRGAAEAAKDNPEAPARTFARIRAPHLREAIESLEIACASPDRAYEVRESAAGWQLVTKPQYSPWLRQLFPEHRSARLSAPALETLAIIAYRQPITRADIEAVRGVAVDGVMQTLLDRGLVKIAGRADVPGRPLLYETTQHFMEHFGLKSLDDLPNAAELRKISLPTADAPAESTPADNAAPAPENGAAPAAEPPAEPAGDASSSEAPSEPEAPPAEPAPETEPAPEPDSPETPAEENRGEN